ncbi:MAG: hypothetical protein ACI4TS_04450 [Bacteroidaceae bacterium]
MLFTLFHHFGNLMAREKQFPDFSAKVQLHTAKIIIFHYYQVFATLFSTKRTTFAQLATFFPIYPQNKVSATAQAIADTSVIL